MKYSILLVAFSISMMACQSTKEKLQAENVKLVANYIKAVEQLDFESMSNYLADNYMGNGPSYGDTIYKAAAVANWKDNVEYLYESIHYNRSKLAPVTITEGDNQGEWVINWAELEIKYKNNGGKVVIWAVTSYHIENGKIVKSITVYNEADALRQLGYQIVPAGTQP
jgi:predicted ester cyclase